ncbi:MAG: glycoside hydrolase family 43 protein [Treponema sp.]|nr:glycoside hydrolase family 43 protein [Treponema sp.]
MSNYSNPVRRGFYPDPSVIRVGDDFYMVNSSFQYFPAIPISHSKDMVHWETIGFAVTNSEWLDLSSIPDSHGIWAPDIEYINGRFFITATLRLAGDNTSTDKVLRRQLIVSSDKAEGPYSRPTWIEIDNIDPSLFVDTDGTPYMAIAPGVRLARLSADLTRAESEPLTAWSGTGERCSEGPHVFFKDGWYYAMVAEGGTGYGHGINVARSRNLFGPYEPSPYNPVMRQKNPAAPIQRSGHGKLVQAQDGSWWCYYLCGRPNDGKFTTCGRETALDRVEWTSDGWFTVNGGRGPSEQAESPCLPAVVYEQNARDDFDSEELARDWQFVRNPDCGNVSLSERPGFLRIWTGDGTLGEIRAKNTLVKREREHCFSAETSLEFEPWRNGEQAGLVCYYSTTTYIRWGVCFEDGKKLILAVNRGDGEKVESKIVLGESNNRGRTGVYLKVVVDHQTRTFFYRTENSPWTKGGTVENCTFLSDEGVPAERKRHTGTLTGIYANNGGCGSRIPADFDYVSMTFSRG